jgi:hypothetical protein
MNDPMTNQDDKPASEPSSSSAAPARRPYRPARLRPLGSVREVTWGGSPTSIEGGLMGVNKKGMM